MKKFLPKLAIAAAALACFGSAHADVITFDGLAASPYALTMPVFGHNDEFYQAGYWLDPFSNAAGALDGDLVGAIVDGSDVANTCFGAVCPTNNPTMFYAALNDGVLALGREDSGLFRVGSLDASFVGASGDAFPAVTLLLQVLGNRADNTTLTTSVQLPGPVAGAFSFSTYALSGAFASTDFKSIYVYGLACNAAGSCSAFSTDKGQFALDNISLTAAVPEPSEWLLMGLGLAAMCAVVRRRTAA